MPPALGASRRESRMNHSLSESGRVWRALELLSVSDPGDSTFAEAADLLKQGADPDNLLSQAVRHGLVPAVADLLAQSGITQSVSSRMRLFLLNCHYANRKKNELATREATVLHGALAEAGVRAAFTKGVVGHLSLYGGRGTRVFNDIDMMAEGDAETIAKVLDGQGYAKNKRYDPGLHQLVDLPRRDQVMYRLSPDHLPHFMRVLDGECVPFLMVDVAFSLTWHASPWQIPTEDALRELVEVPVPEVGTSLPTLHPVYEFLFAAFHLFREAWVERTILKSDVRLTQFADLLRVWRRHASGHRDAVVDRVAAHGLQLPLVWACAHTDTLFGSDLVGELGLDGYRDQDWLRTARGTDGSCRYWSGDIRRRLADPAPPELTTGAPPALPGGLAVFRQS
ncbi:nucleotidyltransferase family protein [Streptomyces sp. DSM 44915]|uniref:Nucleotidyltransferase family protein n=1 Tax=Streptomyces chisholmiae TaxID=3075540 RepID=A0ABU2JM83_9ACTN|nr:nucleotidyltransferase family protein [Streptomyces sp. DSM 44915]MDT0266095.1 nucleotidyltransferase family protein [Streptomyces sp. DSM 44915]